MAPTSSSSLDVVLDTARHDSTAAVVTTFRQRVHRIPGLENGHFYVYNRAILLHSESDGSDQVDDATTHPFLVFNLALASHALGQRLQNRESLMRAGMLYDLLVRILGAILANDENDSGNVGCSERTTLHVLTCIALNNGAALYYELGNHAARPKPCA